MSVEKTMEMMRISSKYWRKWHLHDQPYFHLWCWLHCGLCNWLWLWLFRDSLGKKN